ncbi:MAG: L-serine ammonia-lyase [Bifidobacteriaceae bacterium]|jgi:L-serine dehydratase|nr:L-serine ammonia-lyase [Bifidobacteriaceae bacterium]
MGQAENIYNCVFETFSIGLGPSSSHTVGPMVAAKHFADLVKSKVSQKKVYYKIMLYGSLAATSVGHGSINSILAGLEGLNPDTADPEYVKSLYDNYSTKDDIVLVKNNTLDSNHPNAIRLYAFLDSDKQQEILSRDYFSVGGGTVMIRQNNGKLEYMNKAIITNQKYPFKTMSEATKLCYDHDMTLYQLAKAYELQNHSASQLEAGMAKIWQVMEQSIEGGLQAEGVLPGWLKVPRRAKSIFDKLTNDAQKGLNIENQKLMAYAIAVSEQNADGQRVVTAPTNGAAGVIPAVLYAWVRQQEANDIPQAKIESGIGRFILTANIVCSIIRKYASLAGAEVGCQGEIGSASSMAAAGLTELYGGTVWQIENAAEIALEHHLGLTCDPVGGFVQIPCIERNAISARTAVAAAQLAMCSQGSHIVSLDKTILTMNETGKDMNVKYKETAMGGLAKNFVDC